MDEAPETVVFYEEENEYAMVIDPTDAYLLRDILRRAAEDRSVKASKATQRQAVKRNAEEARVFARYAERCEYIRLDYAKRVGLKLRGPTLLGSEKGGTS